MENNNSNSNASSANTQANGCNEPSQAPQSTTDANEQQAKPILLSDLIGQQMNLTMEERRAISADVSGVLPPEIAMWDERLNALEDEIWHLPAEEKAIFVKLIQENPLLFTILSQQSRLFLAGNGFDAKQAAKRVASYWLKREKMFGKKELPVPSMQYGMTDFNWYYKRSEEVIENPETDPILKQVSRSYIHCVNMCKIAALDQEIAKLLIKQDHLLLWMRESDLVEEAKDSAENIIFIGMDDAEKMLFVRAEDFAEDRAAQRIVNYIGMKYNLFGPILAAKKKITLEDLDEICGELKLGAIRMMLEADAHGRTVILLDALALNDIQKSQEENIVKAFWYIIHAALEDTNCQRNGIVLISYQRRSNAAVYAKNGCFEFIRPQCRHFFANCSPVRLKAYHIFPPRESPTFQTWAHFFMGSIAYIFSQAGEFIRRQAEYIEARVVIHDGNKSQEEELLDLAGYGISKNQLPCCLGGDVSFDSYLAWLEDRKLNGL